MIIQVFEVMILLVHLCGYAMKSTVTYYNYGEKTLELTTYL